MRYRLLTLVLVLAFIGPASAAPPVAHDDAPLRALQFADTSEGWAVGDQGVIWHTIDAGKTWERQPTGTRASLRAVHFLTPYTGWAVGRIELPNAGGSAGVVLTTNDAGATWKELTSHALPGLNAVHFFDETRGIVAGEGTDAFPTGVFRTTDGGKTWSAIPGIRGHWSGINFQDFDTGLMVGMTGHAVVKDGKLSRPKVLESLHQGATAVSRGQRPVVIGRQGMLCTLDKDGTRFESISPLPADKAIPMDFGCVAQVGDELWVGGRPGSVIFHSRDRGATWERQMTGSPAPLHGIHMADAKHGWAVGDLGTILVTNDGGASWRIQKSGGQRTATLFTHARADNLRLGAIATLGRDGYLTAAINLGIDDHARLSAAVRGVGGAVGETDLAITWPGYMTEPTSDREPAMLPTVRNEALLARLVLALRTWRPDVVVTDTISPECSPAEQLTLLHLKEAFVQAADPKAYPEQIEILGLAPHAAKKLYALAANPQDAGIVLDLAAFDPRLGQAGKDFVEPYAQMLDVPNPDRVGFRLVAHRLPGAEQHTQLMQGIELAEGGTARRQSLPAGATAAIDRERDISAKRRVLEALADRPETAGGELKALPQILEGLKNLPEDQYARVSVSIGFRLVREGRLTMAREVLARVVETHGVHAETAEAMRWLIRYHSSGEVRHRVEMGAWPIFQPKAFDSLDDPIQTVGYREPPTTTKAKYRFVNSEAFRQWNQVGLNLEAPLAAFGTVYALNPEVHLALAAARRNLGFQRDLTTTLKVMGAGDTPVVEDGWRARLADEYRFTQTTTTDKPATPTRICRKISARPTLDGKLNDPCWANVEAFEIPAGSASATGYTTRVRLAYDAEHLYVAVECQHPEGKQVPKADKRGRDAKLEGHDRVELFLDLDRDYQTYYRMRVDHRGAVAEDCWGDTAWNPKWFVAHDSSATGWTAEYAIPFKELTGMATPAGQVWSLNVVRIVPGVGVDSWGGPSDVAPRPSSMGLMRFMKE